MRRKTVPQDQRVFLSKAQEAKAKIKALARRLDEMPIAPREPVIKGLKTRYMNQIEKLKVELSQIYQRFPELRSHVATLDYRYPEAHN